jgi:hypothetical protein
MGLLPYLCMSFSHSCSGVVNDWNVVMNVFTKPKSVTNVHHPVLSIELAAIEGTRAAYHRKIRW